jgi:hypothetical protein
MIGRVIDACQRRLRPMSGKVTRNASPRRVAILTGPAFVGKRSSGLRRWSVRPCGGFAATWTRAGTFRCSTLNSLCRRWFRVAAVTRAAQSSVTLSATLWPSPAFG